MTTLLALDPGKTTGLSVWYYSSLMPATMIKHREIKDGINGLIEYFDIFRPFSVDIIVSEKFNLDGRTVKPDTTPLQIEGMLTYISHTFGIPVVFQANNMKTHAKNDFLKEKEIWIKGKPHATDSARHAIAYMKTIGHLPTLKYYFS